MGSVLTPLVAVEVEFRSDSLLTLHCQVGCILNKIDSLLGFSLLSDNAIVVWITDLGQVQHALYGVNIGDICHLLCIRHVCMKLPVEQVCILVNLLPPSVSTCDVGEFQKESHASSSLAEQS